MSTTRSKPAPPLRQPELEPAIWCHLPAHLLDLILARLPLKVLLNLRSTCKYFNSLLYSPNFLSLSRPTTSLSILPPFLLFSHPQFPSGSFCLYNPALNTWRVLSLPRSAPPASALVASSRGLLCFSSSSGSFLVANLLTRSSRNIRSPVVAFTSAAVVPSSSDEFRHGSGYYKLCLISDSPSSPGCSVFVYNSRSRLWSKFQSPEPFHRYNSQQEAVFSNGSLHFTTKEPFSIKKFDLDTEKWGNPIAHLPLELTFIRLVSSREGKLYLIGGVGRDGISRNLKVWELEEGGSGWVVLETLPELMSRKFFAICYHNYEHVYCLWHEGMICIYCYTWPEVLVYKAGRGTWTWLERCPLLPKKWSCGFRWFSFLPDLYALA